MLVKWLTQKNFPSANGENGQKENSNEIRMMGRLIDNRTQMLPSLSQTLIVLIVTRVGPYYFQPRCFCLGFLGGVMAVISDKRMADIHDELASARRRKLLSKLRLW